MYLEAFWSDRQNTNAEVFLVDLSFNPWILKPMLSREETVPHKTLEDIVEQYVFYKMQLHIKS